MYLEVFRPTEHVFEDYFGVQRHVDAEETISLQIIVRSANLSVFELLGPSEYIFEDYSSLRRHADAKATIYSEFECTYWTKRRIPKKTTF